MLSSNDIDNHLDDASGSERLLNHKVSLINRHKEWVLDQTVFEPRYTIFPCKISFRDPKTAKFSRLRRDPKSGESQDPFETKVLISQSSIDFHLENTNFAFLDHFVFKSPLLGNPDFSPNRRTADADFFSHRHYPYN